MILCYLQKNQKGASKEAEGTRHTAAEAAAECRPQELHQLVFVKFLTMAILNTEVIPSCGFDLHF